MGILHLNLASDLKLLDSLENKVASSWPLFLTCNMERILDLVIAH